LLSSRRAGGGPAWELITSAGTCLCCFGLWGVAERELGERADATTRVLRALRGLRLAAAIIGFCAGAVLAFATLAVVLGRMIS